MCACFLCETKRQEAAKRHASSDKAGKDMQKKALSTEQLVERIVL